MTGFHEFLRARLAAGGFSTEDVLASFLPLARQVAGAHAAGRVAPLDGVAALHVEGVRIGFHEDDLEAPAFAAAALERLDPPRAGVEVQAAGRRALEGEGGDGPAASLDVGRRDGALLRPVYLPGYACWEHLLGHHDRVSDVFSLGIVLASLACGLDLAEPAHLEAFVASRRNPFRLNPRLHPVLAKAMVRMTELSRHDRPQELAPLVHDLEHHRHQGVGLDADAAGAGAAGASGAKRPVVLGKLRERLFDLSRRNRLLHFRPTLGSVNLTHASVPRSFDARHVRPERILIWGGGFARALSAGEPVSLGGYLDLAEQPHLPGVLDRIRAEANRDTAELGFAQLRLAICFLRWANPKAEAPEHHPSPLVLLPVRLVKKKGVRDAWWLQPVGTEAEVNPVVRHLFAQLHGVELPASLDLSQTTVDAFFDDLSARVGASEPGITLRKLDRPRVDLAHDGGEGSGEAADDNPYHWDLDLCRVTLGNFRYRKMALVRDYAELLADGARSGAFDAIFSLAPRPVERGVPPAPPLAERHHVVACDPTQASAVALARTGASYVIQGPPGTGKSQTITNLVADYLARGKRVLFVSEKRAAIDVVHARLRRQGLDSLCCLIHDSQADKKAFLQDLRVSYERLLGEPAARAWTWRDGRAALLEAVRRELEPLLAFERAVGATAPDLGVPLRDALDRAIELAAEVPALAASEAEVLPPYAEWAANREAVEALVRAAGELRPDGVLARHPFRLLDPAVAQEEDPAAHVAAGLGAALARLEDLEAALAASGVAERHWRTLDDVLALCAWAAGLEGLARRGLVALLDEGGERSRRLATARRALAAAQERLARAGEATRHWTEKLPADELAAALARAAALEGRWTSVFRPAWWRLTRALRARYALARHAVRPRWSEVLGALSAEYAAAAAVAAAERAGREDLGVEEPLEAVAAQVEAARLAVRDLPRTLRPLHRQVVRSPRCAELVGVLAAARPDAEELHAALAGLLVGFQREPLGALGESLRAMDRALPSLGGALHALGLLARLPPRLAAAFRTLPLGGRALEAAMVDRSLAGVLRADGALRRFDGAARERHLGELERLTASLQAANAGAVLERARESFLEHVRSAALPEGELTPEQKQRENAYDRGRRDLEHEFGKVGRHRSIRDLVAGDSGPVVFDLKPVWLMSPLSVSDTLPLRQDAFDVVIFDEASQIPLESAVPSIFRAPQVIVVGDEMQLPPTDFFAARADAEDEEGLRVGDGGQVFEYDLSAGSLLGHAAKSLPSRMLGWHYRSRAESLIGFSNWAFYRGRLLTVPEERLPAAGRGETIVRDVAEGEANVARLLDRPLSHHLVEHGVYQDRRNGVEAAYVARLVRGLLARPERRSIGIVAFSEAQQGEIEQALADLAAEDAVFAERLEAEWQREEDGQFVGLLVKNLENLQGDERDVVILSVCYGRAPDGRMRMSFGPINQDGGERRLNVAFSRAKHHMCVVASVRHAELASAHSDGARCLRSYLRYAEAASAGDAAAAGRVLREVAAWRGLEEPGEEVRRPVVQQLAAALAERGWAVETGVGQSRSRCDLAVRRPGEPRHRLGVLVEGGAPGAPEELLERDLQRPALLRSFGWRVAQVLTVDWYRDREGVLDRLVSLVERGEPAPQAEAAEEADGRAEPAAVVELAGHPAAQARRNPGGRPPQRGPPPARPRPGAARERVPSRSPAALPASSGGSPPGAW